MWEYMLPEMMSHQLGYRASFSRLTRFTNATYTKARLYGQSDILSGRVIIAMVKQMVSTAVIYLH
jgi:hypothetical protein